MEKKERQKKILAFLVDKKVKLYKSRPLFIKQKAIDCLKSILAHFSRQKADCEYLLNYASA